VFFFFQGKTFTFDDLFENKLKMLHQPANNRVGIY